MSYTYSILVARCASRSKQEMGFREFFSFGTLSTFTCSVTQNRLHLISVFLFSSGPRMRTLRNIPQPQRSPRYSEEEDEEEDLFASVPLPTGCSTYVCYHTHTEWHTHTYARTHARTHAHTHIHTSQHNATHRVTKNDMHAHKLTKCFKVTCTQTGRVTLSHTHTYTHTHTHTHAHTCYYSISSLLLVTISTITISITLPVFTKFVLNILISFFLFCTLGFFNFILCVLDCQCHCQQFHLEKKNPCGISLLNQSNGKPQWILTQWQCNKIIKII